MPSNLGGMRNLFRRKIHSYINSVLSNIVLFRCQKFNAKHKFSFISIWKDPTEEILHAVNSKPLSSTQGSIFLLNKINHFFIKAVFSKRLLYKKLSHPGLCVVKICWQLTTVNWAQFVNNWTLCCQNLLTADSWKLSAISIPQKNVQGLTKL